MCVVSIISNNPRTVKLERQLLAFSAPITILLFNGNSFWEMHALNLVGFIKG